MLREEPQVDSNVPSLYASPVITDLHLKLDLLLDKVESLEKRLSAYESLAAQLPGLLGMLTDTADELYQSASRAGVDVEERLRAALVLLEKLSQPQIVAAVNTLVQHLPMLAELLQQAPGLTAMAVDTLDELYEEARRHGVDIETILRRGLEATKVLLESGVFHPEAVKVVGNAGYALVESQKSNQHLGLFGLLRMLRDPDIQRANGFLIAFAKHFGSRLNQ
jgi:uncharacterized protein YjgD (DUF1641 family)